MYYYLQNTYVHTFFSSARCQVDFENISFVFWRNADNMYSILYFIQNYSLYSFTENMMKQVARIEIVILFSLCLQVMVRTSFRPIWKASWSLFLKHFLQISHLFGFYFSWTVLVENSVTFRFDIWTFKFGLALFLHRLMPCQC